MYVCSECEKLSNEIGSWVEPHGERLSGCEYCGGSVAETFKCDCCNQYITDDFIHTNDNYRYCPDCTQCRSVFDY